MEGFGVVSLLRAAWFLATFPIVVAWFPLPGLAWLHTALLEVAKRGKILQSNNRLTVPQRFFAHFYVVGILWTTILLVAVWFYAVVMVPSLNEDYSCTTMHRCWLMKENVWVCVFMLLLMEAHVLRRFYESIYVFTYSPSARMHIILYLGGILYYIATPLSLCGTFASEVFDFIKNGYLEGGFIVNGKNLMLKHEDNIFMFVTPLLRLEWYAWIGAAIFLWGWLHQLRCHQILGSLRKNPEKLGEYAIPYGDWFEYVSSPHYTAEIVIYLGLVIASGGSDLSLWLLFALVVANLGFAANITHGWYLQKFEDYPRNRYAIFPFVY